MQGMRRTTTNDRWRGLALAAAVALANGALAGCGGGASLVLKAPIADKCAESGLKACDTITEGALLFAEGKKAEGKAKLQEGVAANSPDDVRTFARAVRLIGSLPGVNKYAGVAVEIATFLDAEAPASASTAVTASAGAGASASQAPQGGLVEYVPSPRPAPQESAGRTRTVSTVVVGHPRAFACSPLAKSNVAGLASSTCVRVATGPAVVTDLHASAACSADIFVLAGAVDAPSWHILAGPREGLHMHSGKLTLTADDDLIVGLHPTSSATPAREAACAITWSVAK